MLSIIVAMAEGNAIGRKNGLLWHISEDLKYFKNVTSGHSVIMGRKTYESIGKPLPNRENIVITRQENIEGDILNPDTTSLLSVNSIEKALENTRGEQEFFVIGGGEIYRQTIEMADKLYITKIFAEAQDADTFFPSISEEIWEIENEGEMMNDTKNNIDFKFLTYKKR